MQNKNALPGRKILMKTIINYVSLLNGVFFFLLSIELDLVVAYYYIFLISEYAFMY